jgi:murein DD-endopeptidase MepM/ murein hydrolase activator NlpD
VGSTGLSTGAHLHWEMRVDGIAVDPLQWVEK